MKRFILCWGIFAFGFAARATTFHVGPGNGPATTAARPREAPSPLLAHRNPAFDVRACVPEPDYRGPSPAPYVFSLRQEIGDLFVDWVRAQEIPTRPEARPGFSYEDANRTLNDPAAFLRWIERRRTERARGLVPELARRRSEVDDLRRRLASLGTVGAVSPKSAPFELFERYVSTLGGRAGNLVRAVRAEGRRLDALRSRLKSLQNDPTPLPEGVEPADHAARIAREITELEAEIARREKAVDEFQESHPEAASVDFLLALDPESMPLSAQLRRYPPEVGQWADAHADTLRATLRAIPVAEALAQAEARLGEAEKAERTLANPGSLARALVAADLLAKRRELPWLFAFSLQPGGDNRRVFHSSQIFRGEKRTSRLLSVEETDPVARQADSKDLRGPVRRHFEEAPTVLPTDEPRYACPEAPVIAGPDEPLEKGK